MLLKELQVKITATGAREAKREIEDIGRALDQLSAKQQQTFTRMNSMQQRLQRGLVGGPATGGAGGTTTGGNAVDGLNKSLDQFIQKLGVGKDRALQLAQVFSSAAFLKIFSSQGQGFGATRSANGRFVQRDQMNPFLQRGLNYLSRSDIGIFDTKRTGALGDFENGRQKFLQPMREYRFSPEGLMANLQPVIQGLGVYTAALAIGVTATIAFVNASKEMLTTLYEAGSAAQDLNTRLLALTGSQAKTDSLKNLFSDIAGPSAFTYKQIAEAGTQLQAYGVNVKRSLPLIAMLGQAFGASNEQLQMYVGFIGRLKGGYLDEVLGRLGITKADLKKQGIEFDSGGSLQSSAEKTMVAIEKIVLKKYGSIFKLTQANASTMAASLTDSFDRIKEQASLAYLLGIQPFQANMGKVASAIQDSGIAKAIGDNMTKPYINFLEVFVGSTDTIARAAAYMAAAIEEPFIGLNNLLNKARVLAIGVGAQAGALAEGASPSDALAAGVIAQRSAEMVMTAAGQPKSFDERRNQYLYQIMRSMNKKGRGFPGGGTDPFFGGDGSEGKMKDQAAKNAANLQRIANNTKKSAELLDLRRQTIGGGPIASLGLTGHELAGMGLQMRSEITMKGPIRASTSLERGVRDIVRSEGYKGQNGMIRIR